MKKFTHWIAAKTIKNHQSINDLKVRTQYGTLEGYSSIVINILLFAVKLFLGLSIKSVSLIADAIHTLSDSATSIVVIIGFKIAQKPSDKEHPFGHGQMESVAALIVSILLFVTGIELLQQSIHRIIHPQTTTASLAVIIVVIATMIIKELMSRFSYELGRIIDSPTLKADAFHHRTDVVSTALVVVALIAARFDYKYIDGLMGIGVSLIIFYSAYLLAKKSITPLLGQAPSKETLKEIETLATAHAGVQGIHDIISHRYGQTSIISLHIEVSDKESALKLHALAEAVEETITAKTHGMVIVHIDPINKEHPQYESIAQTIKKIISQDSRVDSFHELRIVGQHADKCNVVFDIALAQNADVRQTSDIIHSIQAKFNQQFPQMKLFIKAEPKFVYNP